MFLVRAPRSDGYGSPLYGFTKFNVNYATRRPVAGKQRPQSPIGLMAIAPFNNMHWLR